MKYEVEFSWYERVRQDDYLVIEAETEEQAEEVARRQAIEDGLMDEDEAESFQVDSVLEAEE